MGNGFIWDTSSFQLNGVRYHWGYPKEGYMALYVDGEQRTIEISNKLVGSLTPWYNDVYTKYTRMGKDEVDALEFMCILTEKKFDE
jgi:hypothetical protein